MRRARDGEARWRVGQRPRQGCFCSSFWLAVAGRYYNLSLLHVPGEVGREESSLLVLLFLPQGGWARAKAPVISVLTKQPSQAGKPSWDLAHVQ